VKRRATAGNVDEAIEHFLAFWSHRPGVLPQYRLEAGPATFAVVLRELPG
jgi:hypothetical protein